MFLFAVLIFPFRDVHGSGAAAEYWDWATFFWSNRVKTGSAWPVATPLSPMASADVGQGFLVFKKWFQIFLIRQGVYFSGRLFSLIFRLRSRLRGGGRRFVCLRGRLGVSDGSAASKSAATMRVCLIALVRLLVTDGRRRFLMTLVKDERGGSSTKRILNSRLTIR